MSKRKVTSKKAKAELSERDNYLRNRNHMLEDFEAALKEVQRDKPSVGGKICGMDFQQFSAISVFRSILEQEEYIEYTKKYKPTYVILTEEEALLKDMVSKAKAVFGEHYDSWMDHAKDQ